MPDDALYILFIDDYHGGDVLFLQGLSRALAKKAWQPAPILVHGSGEHAERLLESEGIFRERSSGVLEIESPAEHALVERALRSVNQKLVGLLTDAVVSSIGVIGAQRRVFMVRGGRVHSPAIDWLWSLCRKRVVPVVAANALDERTTATGEIDITSAVIELAREAERLAPAVNVVFFTKTNLPGIMHGGQPRPTVSPDDAALSAVVPEPEPIRRVVGSGLDVLITNTNRFADPDGPIGTRVCEGAS